MGFGVRRNRIRALTSIATRLGGFADEGDEAVCGTCECEWLEEGTMDR